MGLQRILARPTWAIAGSRSTGSPCPISSRWPPPTACCATAATRAPVRADRPDLVPRALDPGPRNAALGGSGRRHRIRRDGASGAIRRASFCATATGCGPSIVTRLTITLQAVLDYAARQGRGRAPDDPGRRSPGRHHHRPGRPPRVPIHVIGPPDLVARTDGWGLTRGLVPEPGSPAMPMEALRDRFMRNFSGSLDVPPA